MVLYSKMFVQGYSKMYATKISYWQKIKKLAKGYNSCYNKLVKKIE